MRILPLLVWASLIFVLSSCAMRPPKTIRLPEALNEASGLAIRQGVFTWHNDSGDGPFLYQTDAAGRLTNKLNLPTKAVDYEDLTQDPSGRFYVGDFGNNTGQRTAMTIYRYDPKNAQTDTIEFTFHGQNGEGRDVSGNYDCEAMVFQSGKLHLFTKDQVFRRGRFFAYHFTVPAQPGVYEAELVDSLYLPRRVVTAAAVDSMRGELVLTAYNFHPLIGKIPGSAASLITITDYPKNRFFRGKIHRRNLSWAWPTQFEAVDFYDDKWLYVASEATRVRKHAVAKRKRRK